MNHTPVILMRAKPGDLEPPPNPGELHSRIPPETSGLQYNFCKNLKCS